MTLSRKVRMKNYPSLHKRWEYENGFYLTCAVRSFRKSLVQWELFKLTSNLPGAIVECGVFKGASFARFAMFRELLSGSVFRKLIGFDSFGRFPDASFEEDKPFRERFVREAGDWSISVEQMMEVLANKKCEQNVELVAGDICKTVPKYVEQNPQLKIALLNLDTDLYEPATIIMEYLYPRIVKGGVLIIDNYKVFPGETKAVDEYLAKNHPYTAINRLPFSAVPCYVVKGEGSQE